MMSVVRASTDDHPGDASGPDAALRALADPRRRDILRLVRRTELAAGQIGAHFDITQQAVSQHLRLLERAGLLTERREGARRLYALRPEAIDQNPRRPGRAMARRAATSQGRCRAQPTPPGRPRATMTSPDTVTATVRIAAPPTAVFPYLVEPALLAEWLGGLAEMAPQPGGVFAVDVGESVRGHWVTIDPPKASRVHLGRRRHQRSPSWFDNRGDRAHPGRSGHDRPTHPPRPATSGVGQPQIRLGEVPRPSRAHRPNVTQTKPRLEPAGGADQAGDCSRLLAKDALRVRVRP